MEDIIIAGYSVSELKKQRAAIQKEASKIVSDSVSKALKLFPKLKEVESQEEANKIATEMHDYLETAQIVAGVSGVTFFLPYTEEYGQYESNEVIGSYLENLEYEDDEPNEFLSYEYGDETNPIYRLMSLAQDMESDSCNWHSSRC